MNQIVAKMLREIAALLEKQGANHFRVNAYRRAAKTLESLDEPVENIVERDGIEGLIRLPGIGEGIARSVWEFATRGRMTRLEALRGAHDPVRLFEQIPGVGPRLAGRIHDHLHVDSLEALEIAAHIGRLRQVPGMGQGRVESIKAWLSSVLGKRRSMPSYTEPLAEPSVGTLLDIDKRYRGKALEDKLPKIAPKRFNPTGEAWLPIFHVTRGGWHFTALFSNTPRAHQLHRTHDWVVIYYYDENHHEGQHTVVTEVRGPLAGKRVVRGREEECRNYYLADAG